MPKIDKVEEPNTGTKTIKRCPQCHATRFQGPWMRGEIMGNGVFVKFEELYNCVGCHNVFTVEQMEDLEVPIH